MSKYSKVKLLILLACSCFWVFEARADINCSSTSTVQAAVDSASPGDTITCSAGGWSGTITIGSNDGPLTLDCNGVSVGGALTVNSNSIGLNRVTGCTFTKTPNDYDGYIRLRATKGHHPIRLDNCTFTNTSNSKPYLNPSGDGLILIDHNNFSGGSAQESLHIYGGSWTDSYTPGSRESIFIEDNTFNGPSSGNPSWIQSYYGSRVVIRYNKFNNWSYDNHGTAGMVGGRYWEVYLNNFNNGGSSNQGAAINMRAGSGIIFQNDASGSQHSGYIGLCEEDSGYPALYQIGRGQNQILYPAYVWDNISINPRLNSCEAPEQPNMVQLNRDVYYPSSGTSLPGSCTNNQAYWKTDEGGNWDTTHGGANDGKLYKCIFGSWQSYYTPYEYPHPLQDHNQSTVTPPNPPTNFRKVQQQ